MTTPATRRRGRRWLIAVIGLLLAGLLGRGLLMFGPTPRNTGVVEGRLQPCPSSPNCVCSHAPDSDATHSIPPIKFDGDAAATWTRLRQVINGLPRTRVVQEDDAYLHVEFTTALLRFVDDVEFLLDSQAGVIHVRSASRVGHSDLGTNRRRIESIRQQFPSTTGT